MPHNVETFAGRLGEFRAASTADGGTLLGTTASLISLPFGATFVSLTARNFTGSCAVVKFAINPWLTCVYTDNLLVTPGHATDISEEAQDGDATDNNIAAWATLANGSCLYVGSPVKFRGVKVDIGTTANATAASVLTIKYWDGNTGWVDTGNSEGTTDAGKCLAVDGDETWTPDALWTKATLQDTGDTVLTGGVFGAELYWTRWEADKALTANMDIIQLRALNRSTAYAELLNGQNVELMIQSKGKQPCVEALTNADAANLVVNVATDHGKVFD